jgi:hypothetical protein
MAEDVFLKEIPQRPDLFVDAWCREADAVGPQRKVEDPHHPLDPIQKRIKATQNGFVG